VKSESDVKNVEFQAPGATHLKKLPPNKFTHPLTQLTHLSQSVTHSIIQSITQ